MVKKLLPVLYNNIGSHFSKRLKSSATKISNEKKPATDFSNNLPSLSKQEDVRIQNIPSIDFTPIKNAIDFPMMVSSFFNKRMEQVFKDLLFIEPIKQTEFMGKQQPFNTVAEFSEKGMTIAIEMKGFKEEDITIRIEGPWLVIEGQSTVSVPEKEGGGLHVRHIIRRYEVPPNSDVANIKSNFKSETLTVTIPSLKPKSTKGHNSIMCQRISKKQSSSFTPFPLKPLTVRNLFNFYNPSKIKCQDNSKKNKSKDTTVKESIPCSKSSVAFTDKGMFVQMDVKGFTKENIEVTVEGTKLQIDAQHEEVMPKEKGGGKNFQQIYRIYDVPANSDLDNITAEIVDDRLKIAIPTVKPEIKWK